MILTFEEFIEHYKRWGKCVNDISPSKKPLSDDKLFIRYEKYLIQENKKLQKELKVDEEWIRVSSFVRDRDRGECQLLRNVDFILGVGAAQVIRNNSNGMCNIIDVAHIFGRGAYPHLKYDPENCVCLNRYSHTFIDLYKDPFEGRFSLSKADRMYYFSWMVGEEKIKKLQLKAKGYEA